VRRGKKREEKTEKKEKERGEKTAKNLAATAPECAGESSIGCGVFVNAGLLIVSAVSALSRELAVRVARATNDRIGSKSKTTEARFLFSSRCETERATARHGKPHHSRFS